MGSFPGTYKRGGGLGGPNFRPERIIEVFRSKILLTETTTCSHSVNADHRWREKYCFANRREQITGGYPKTITLLNFPEMKFSDKMQRAFH